MPAQNAAQHVYRFALYGLRSSGKTCILSALSLPRVAHPDGLSCSWIENVPGHALPPGDPRLWQTDDPYHIGWQWLSEQREQLRAGELPAPNPNRDPMRFLFDFGSPDHGTRHVELIDYSGELITASASELAAILRDHMRECDGLLILAEVPHPNGDHAPLVDDLEKLAGAFRELLNERDEAPRQEWPIALLFNKWDRRNSANSDGHRALSVLDGFLDQSPSPPHASLRNTIRNAVGHENALCLPVSAFGSHGFRDDGAEVPRLTDGRLQSFGLEDGFVWVAQRCDSLRVEQLETAAQAASWWAFPQIILGTGESNLAKEKSPWKRWLCGASTRSGISSAWRLCRRFPMDSQLHSRTIRALRQFALKFASQVAVFVVLMLTLVIVGETTFDGVTYRSILATKNDPAATVDQLEHGEAWLESYFTSPSFRHCISTQIIIGRSEAHRLLVDFRTRRDEALWQTVLEAQKSQTQVGLAHKYLVVFPSGLHHSEAEGLVAEAVQQEQELKNREHLDQVALKIIAIEPHADAPLGSLLTLSEAVDAIPHPDARSPSISGRQKEMRDQIAEKQSQIAEAARQSEWRKFKQTYVSLMQSKNISEAAKALDGRHLKDAELRELLDDFTKRAPVIVETRVRDAVKVRSWQLARESARIIADPNVVRLLPAESIKKLQGLGREIDEAEDRDLYAQVLRYKPQCSDQVDAYLSRAPLKTMKADVDAYSKYITTINGPLTLTLTLTGVAWHSRYYGSVYSYRNDLTVDAKGTPLIAASGIKSKPNTTSANLGTGAITARLNETITIDASIVARYGVVWDSTMSGGKGTWTGTPDQLRSGVSIDLSGDGFTNRATFTLQGIPPEPTMPQWRSR
jgi:hypothetical protein